MGGLIAATVVMAGTHLVPALPGVRDRLRRRLGPGFYGALHGTLSLAALVLLVLAWRAAGPVASDLDGGMVVKRAAVLLMPLALLLILAGLTTRPGGAPRGIHTLTATPVSLGLALWALLHLPALSDGRGVVVFTGFLGIALGSMVRNLRDAPPAFRQVGPFRLVGVDWRGIGGWRVAAALALWSALLVLHPLVLGPDPAALVMELVMELMP